MDLFVHGIPRSGSTLVWQIVNGLFPNVYKTHPDGSVLKEGFYFITFRHPYDVMASRFRVRISRTPVEEHEKMGAFSDELYHCERFFVNLKQQMTPGGVLYDAEKTHPNVLLFYEQFWNDFDIIFSTIEYFLHIRIPEAKRKELAGYCSLKENLKRASTLSSFNEVDTKTNIHGDHIGMVTPGNWKYTVPSWGMEPMKQKLSPICKEWNYETY